MIFGTDSLWLVNLAKERGSRLMAIKIPKNAISNIRQELKDAGITESVGENDGLRDACVFEFLPDVADRVLRNFDRHQPGASFFCQIDQPQ